MAHVEAAEPALDVRNRGWKRSPDQCAEHRRHGVAVEEDQRLSGAGLQGAPQHSAPAQIGIDDSREPPRYVRVEAEVAATRSAREPMVGLPQTELVQEGRNLVDLPAVG